MESYTGQQTFANTDLVNYHTAQDGTGGYQVGNCWIEPSYWDKWWNNEIHHWYPTYHVVEKNQVEQAFKIIGKLIEKKIVKDLTVKQFIELVNEISTII